MSLKNRFSVGFWIWVSVVLFYLYQYILRVSPSVMADQIMGSFAIDAGQFGFLSALATYMYATLQIPAGILSDLYGTRRMTLVSILSCVIGVFLFSTTNSLLAAYGARILIGAGSACAFLCVTKVASEWFAPEKKIFYLSLTVTAGTVGALLGGKPLAFLSKTYGWQMTLLWVGILGGVIFLLNYTLLRDRPTTPTAEGPCSGTNLKQDILSVFKNKNCWLYALVGTGVYLSISVFADLWGVSYLMLKMGVQKETAAELVSLIYVGSCMGCLLIFPLTKSFSSIKGLIFLGSCLLVLILGFLIYGPALSYKTTAILLFLLGMATGTEILCFSCACQSMPVSVAATVTGFINSIVTLGSAFIQQQVGFILDILWKKSGLGMATYTASDYEIALLPLVLGGAFSSALMGWDLIRNRFSAHRSLASAQK